MQVQPCNCLTVRPPAPTLPTKLQLFRNTFCYHACLLRVLGTTTSSTNSHILNIPYLMHNAYVGRVRLDKKSPHCGYVPQILEVMP